MNDFDAITEAELIEAGSMKWTMHPGTIGAWVAEMDFGLAPAIREALDEAFEHGLTGYLAPRLSAEMATATSNWYRERYGWDVTADRVHPAPDVISVLEAAIEHFTPPGSAVIVPTPAYMPFLFVPTIHGRDVIQIPALDVDGRMRMDLDAIGRAFDEGAGLLVLCNPHNPLGTVFTADELSEVSAVVAAKGGRVFADEIHAPLVYGPNAHVPYASTSPEAASHTITAASASKAWNLAGLKCAQVILSNESDARTWQEVGRWVGHGTSTLGVIANTAAYRAGGAWLAEVIEYLDGNRRLLAALVAEHLPAARVTMPEGTYIALIDFRGYGLQGDLGEWFRTHARVSMTDGAACGQAAVGHARFVFALPRPLLRTAVERMGAALAEHATPISPPNSR